jgi:hypothetical protein
MTDISRDIVALASDMIATDSQSFVSNLPLAELVETRLRGFEVERLDWVEPSGVAKRALVARSPSRRTWTRCPPPAGKPTPSRPTSMAAASCTASAPPT